MMAVTTGTPVAVVGLGTMGHGIAQAFAGIMHVTGPADGPPHPVGVGMADISTGVHAFSAIGYALFHRERTGEGVCRP